MKSKVPKNTLCKCYTRFVTVVIVIINIFNSAGTSHGGEVLHRPSSNQPSALSVCLGAWEEPEGAYAGKICGERDRAGQKFSIGTTLSLSRHDIAVPQGRRGHQQLRPNFLWLLPKAGLGMVMWASTVFDIPSLITSAGTTGSVNI